ncbi:FHA domain-containing protein [Candidatus Woesearchaeota archaeon]|nr:FHA domain-containing protein [Candidatus Woesearchaeota archaeon]
MTLRIEQSAGVTWFGEAKNKDAIDQFPNAKDTVEFTDDSCKQVVAKKPVMTIGRDPNNTIMLGNKTVSKFGCMLQQEVTGWFWKTEKWFVKDIGSRNPILIIRKGYTQISVPKDDGVSKGVQLEDEDVLAIGYAVLMIHLT